MKKRLLLGSCINQAIGKMGFLFDKPLKHLKVICIPTAANVYTEENKAWLYDEMKAFTDMGITLDIFDIEGKRPIDFLNKIKDADVVYVTGGNTYFLLEHMQKCDFKSALNSHLAKGGLYIGSSAGSVVACPRIDFIKDMDEPEKANLSDYTGLNLVDFYVMPHIDHPSYVSVARGIIEEQRGSFVPFLGLKDSQAIVVIDNYIEVF